MTMKSVLGVIAILAFSSLLRPDIGQAADEKIELKFRLAKGETYGLKATIKQEIVQWVQDAEQKTTLTMGVGETLNVKDVDAQGTMTVQVEIASMSVKMKGEQAEVEYDSENPPEEVALPAKLFAAMVGQSFTMKLTPQGHVSELTGVDQMLQKVFDAIEVPDPQMKEAVLADLKRQFGDAALGEMMERTMAIFPDKPVGVGDSWTQTMTLNTGFPSITENTWTLTGRKDGVATVEVKSTLKPNEKAAPMKMGPFSMTFDLSGTQTGTFKLDEATGWFVGGTITQDISGEMSVTGAPDTQGEIKVPMTIQGVTTIEPVQPATAPE
jgi:hypothetical protein